jgi:hypothetical protein
MLDLGRQQLVGHGQVPDLGLEDRHPLSDHARKTLAKRQALVDNDIDPRARAHRLWRQRKNRAFEEIRSVLNLMATGRSRCMYCEDNEGTDIEHFYPRASDTERAFLWENFAGVRKLQQ